MVVHKGRLHPALATAPVSEASDSRRDGPGPAFDTADRSDRFPLRHLSDPSEMPFSVAPQTAVNTFGVRLTRLIGSHSGT